MLIFSHVFLIPCCLFGSFVRGIVHPSFFFLLPLPTSYFLPLLRLLLLLLCCSHLCLELRRLVPCVGPASLNWLPSCPLTSWVLSVQHCQSIVPSPRVPTRFVPLSAQCIAVFGRANHWSPVPLRGNVRLCCVWLLLPLEPNASARNLSCCRD